MAADYGVLRYPDYRVHRSCRVFGWAGVAPLPAVGARAAVPVFFDLSLVAGTAKPFSIMSRLWPMQLSLPVPWRCVCAVSALRPGVGRERDGGGGGASPGGAAFGSPSQAGDVPAAEAVLQHAWAALDAGAHKCAPDGGSKGQPTPVFLQRFHGGGASAASVPWPAAACAESKKSPLRAPLLQAGCTA